MKSSGLADSPFFGKQNNNEKQQPNHYDTMVSSNQDITILKINEAIQEIGKEASTYRLSKGEKISLIKIKYEFNLENIHLSENEIIRIALNLLINDYYNEVENSILLRVKNISIK